MRLTFALLACLSLCGCANTAATAGRPRHREVAGNFHGGERPVLALWQDDSGNSIQALRPPFLRVAFWADGHVVFAKDPASWSSDLCAGQIPAFRLAQLESDCLATGVFDLARSTELVPDSETDLMLLAIRPHTILLQSSGPRGGVSDLDRCWTEITRLALASLPSLYVPATEAFRGAPASWYLEPEASTANAASPTVADADEGEVIVPSEDDRKVVEAALLRLMDDPAFDPFPGFKSGRLVLDVRTEDAMLVHTPDTTESETRTGSWAGVVFDPRILVADLRPMRTRRSHTAFEDSFPTERGWVAVDMPTYAADGLQATVRAFFGPTPHGASYTALLAKVGDAWVVVRASIEHYV